MDIMVGEELLSQMYNFITCVSLTISNWNLYSANKLQQVSVSNHEQQKQNPCFLLQVSKLW
jgi:hypothetical protein